MRLDVGSQLADRRVSEWMRLEQARRGQPDAAAAPLVGLAVTISRQYGAGGNSIAELVAARLGSEWQVWNRELIEAVANSAKVRSEMVEFLDERTRNWIEQMVYHVVGVKTMDESSYRRHLAQVLLALGHQGKMIFVGRGANYILKDALHVRLCAPFETRVLATMKLKGISHADAVKEVHAVDHERGLFVKNLFGRDVDHLEDYDLVLRSDRLGYEVSAEIVVGAIQAKMAAVPPEHAVVAATSSAKVAAR